MLTLKLSDGKFVSVSSEIYVSNVPNSNTRWINELTNQPIDNPIHLWRKISMNNTMLGWHPRISEGYNCYIPLCLCYDGVKRMDVNGSTIYCGIHASNVKILKTHPLNMKSIEE